MPPPPARNVLKVVLWMAGSLTSFIVVALAVRGLQHALTVFEMLALRNLGGLVILALMVMASGRQEHGFRQHVFRPARPGLHLFRNVAHTIGQALWFYAVTVLPLALVFAIEFTTPMWVALFAVLFLGERMTVWRAMALVCGFVGVLVILRPGLEGFRIEALAVVAAAIFFGIQITTTKVLTASNSTWTIMFWMNLMQLPLNLVGNMAMGHSAWFLPKLDPSLWLPVLAIAISGFTAHYCLTNAFRHGDATLVVPIDFLRVPLIALIGWALYGERLEWALVIGTVIVIGGVVFNLLGEGRAKTAQMSQRP
jgi:drug/metabolite transporter (DMT)-like permease